MDETTLKDTLLEAILPNVPFDGWTARAMRFGADSAGIGADDLLRAFPDGIPDVIEHFSDWADRRTLESVDLEALAGMRVRDRIATLVRTRLTVLEPYRDTVQRSAVVLSWPGQARRSTRMLYRTCDVMWEAAGDTATDHNRYTKRLLLAGVIGSTTAYWINDSSADFANSWTFLDRRIDNVLKLGRTVGKVADPLARAGSRMASPLRMWRRGSRTAGTGDAGPDER